MNVTLDEFRQLRVGGMDLNALSQLSDVGLSQWLRKITQAQHFLTCNRDEISDRLHRIIPQVEGSSSDRRNLITLRRSLFNLQWSTAAHSLNSLSGEVLTLVNGTIPRSVEIINFWQVAYQELAKEFDTWVNTERVNTLKLLEEPNFARGVSVAASTLMPALHRMKEHDGRGIFDNKDKKAYRSLISYLLRATSKTSPFSTLGPVAIVPSSLNLNGNSGDLKVKSRWSIYPVARILNSLSSQPSELSRFTITLSPYACDTSTGTTIARTQWHFREITSGNDYAQCVESRVHLGQKALTDVVLRSLKDHQTLGELHRDVVAHTGMSDSQIDTLFATLLRLGFIQATGLTIHPNGIENLDQTLEQLQATERGHQLADILSKLHSTATNFAGFNEIDERLQLLAQMKDLVASAYGVAEIKAAVPRSVVYEDALITSDAVRTPRISISDDDAIRLARFLNVFDQANIKHDLMKGFFFQKVGADSVATDALSFVSQFEEELLDSFEGYDYSELSEEELKTDPWLKWGESWRWVSAQRTIATRFQEGVRKYATGTRIAHPGAIKLDETVDKLGDLVGTPNYQHLNILCQTDGNTTVINDSFGGVGFLVSRFSHLLDTDCKRFTRYTELRAAEANVRIAEVTGGAVFTNLNLHTPVMSTELVVDGDPIGSESQHKLSVHDLIVRYSKEEDRLILEHPETHEHIHPHYPGYLVAGAIPRHHQSFLLFSPSSSYTRKPMDLVDAHPIPGIITTVARMTLGNLVISRAQYRISASDLPCESPLTMCGYWEWVNFWLKHNLPTRLFAKLAGSTTQRYKPSLVDLGIVTSIEVLHNALRECPKETFVILTECLPDPRTSKVFINGMQRVSESMIGINLVREAK